MKYILLACVIFTVATAMPLRAQTTGFTYQGSLTNGGVAANGSYDFEFVLFDASGNQVGTTITVSNVIVTNGIFSTRLDFGSQFPGASRFLEIHVRQTGGGTFNTLSPRQSIDSSPYSIKSLTADNAITAANATNATNFSGGLAGDVAGTQTATVVTAVGGQSSANVANAVQSINAATANNTASTVVKRDASGNFAAGTVTGNLSGNATTATSATQLGGVAASQYVLTGDSRLTDSRAPAPGSSSYIQNSTSLQSSSNFNITGNGTAAGTLSALNVNANAQYNLNGAAILTHPNQNLFVGLSAGTSTTVSGGNTFVGDSAGQSNTSGIEGVFFGLSAGITNTTGTDNAFFGYSSGLSNKTGSFNTFIGNDAGFNFVTGNQNTALGVDATVTSGLNNATAIGASALVTQSNSLVLGSINGQNEATVDTNVGIGTTAPTARLTVVSNTVNSGDNTALFMAPNIGPNKSHINFGTTGDWFIRSAKDGGTIIIQDSPGNVGIGTGSPDQKLTVNGNASKTGGGSWATFSDARLKNIKGSFTPGLKAVMQLQPIRYEYKHDNALNLVSDGEHVGFSAQELQKVIPEAVTKNDKGYLLVNNDPVIWTMLNAIKEQQAEIEAKQREIDRQNAINKREEAEIEGLKALVCRSHRSAAACLRKN